MFYFPEELIEREEFKQSSIQFLYPISSVEDSTDSSDNTDSADSADNTDSADSEHTCSLSSSFTSILRTPLTYIRTTSQSYSEFGLKRTSNITLPPSSSKLCTEHDYTHENLDLLRSFCTQSDHECFHGLFSSGESVKGFDYNALCLRLRRSIYYLRTFDLSKMSFFNFDKSDVIYDHNFTHHLIEIFEREHVKFTITFNSFVILNAKELYCSRMPILEYIALFAELDQIINIIRQDCNETRNYIKIFINLCKNAKVNDCHHSNHSSSEALSDVPDTLVEDFKSIGVSEDGKLVLLEKLGDVFSDEQDCIDSDPPEVFPKPTKIIC